MSSFGGGRIENMKNKTSSNCRHRAGIEFVKKKKIGSNIEINRARTAQTSTVTEVVNSDSLSALRK